MSRRNKPINYKPHAVPEYKKEKEKVIDTADKFAGALVVIGALLASNFFSDSKRTLGIIFTFCTIAIVLFDLCRHLTHKRRWHLCAGAIGITLVACWFWWKPRQTTPQTALAVQATATPLVTASLLLAHSTPATSPPPPSYKPPPTTEKITNTPIVKVQAYVMDATSPEATFQSDPLDNVRVVIRSTQNTQPPIVIEARSDTNGKFDRQLRIGEYQITATKKLYFDESYTYTASADSASGPWVIKMRRNWDDQSNQPTGTIFLNVYGERIPLQGVRVTVASKSAPSQILLEDVTDRSGHLEFHDVTHVGYHVTFKRDGYEKIT